MKQLSLFEIREDIFNNILNDYESKIIKIDNLSNYIYGYKNKRIIYYEEKTRTMILPEYIVNYYCNNIKGCTEWKQIRIKSVENMEETAKHIVTGTWAYNYMMNEVLSKYYTKEELEERFKLFESDYDTGLKQYHYFWPCENNEIIYQFTNCYQLDINGAHTDALCEIFPKAEKKLKTMYKLKHTNTIYKQIPNFFVGALCRKGHRRTYNWIVQRTTHKLLDAIKFNNGDLLYANTDGYVIQLPEKLQLVSESLGDFKLEYKGDAYIYQDKNYWIIKAKDYKGSALTSIRKDIDLENGMVVHYKKTKMDNGAYKATNIIKEKLKWQKIEL